MQSASHYEVTPYCAKHVVAELLEARAGPEIGQVVHYAVLEPEALQGCEAVH